MKNSRKIKRSFLPLGLALENRHLLSSVANPLGGARIAPAHTWLLSNGSHQGFQGARGGGVEPSQYAGSATVDTAVLCAVE